MPHITLAEQDLRAEALQQIMTRLFTRELFWEFGRFLLTIWRSFGILERSKNFAPSFTSRRGENKSGKILLKQAHRMCPSAYITFRCSI